MNQTLKFSVIVASNSDRILNSSLMASPDLRDGVEICVQRGAASAAVAYNRGIASTQAEVMIFVHQDVYLPPGWMHRLDLALDWLSIRDPDWGVLGLFGVEHDGTGQGYLYSTGLKRVIGQAFLGARQVEALDEVMLILRRSSGLHFDEELSGYHLYGADICLEARNKGLKSYAISALALHNTNGIAYLPKDYWKVWWRMRRKWRKALPIMTPCMPITICGGAALRYLVRRPLQIALGRVHPGRRVEDPAALWVEEFGKSLST